jgi:hypothetical protein
MEFEKRQSGLLVPAKVLFKGRYDCTLIRKGHVIDEWSTENLITNEGLNATLNVMLNGSSQLTSWYLALYTGNYTPIATDTAASLPGNATETSAYTSATRPQWTPAAASGQSISNSASRASYTFNASNTIYGAFMTSSSVVGGTSGTSFSAALFGSSKNVVNTDQLLLTYTFSAASA